MTKTDQNPTENRLKTDPPQDPDRCLPRKEREGSVAEMKVLMLERLYTMLGANLSVRFFFGGAWFRNYSCNKNVYIH